MFGLQFNQQQQGFAQNPRVVITLEGYKQLKTFYAFMDNLKKPHYWVSPLFINYALGASLSGLMDIIRIDTEKDKYIKKLAEGGYKKIFDFIVPVDGHNNKFIIKFESISDPTVLNKWCYDATTCNFVPSIIKSVKYKDNYNSTPGKIASQRVCIINTPSQIVESFYSLLNTKYYKDGVSPCLLKTYLTTIVNNESCTKKDIECLANSVNSNDYNRCMGEACKSLPLFNEGFGVYNHNKVLNGNVIKYIDGRYVLTVQEKIEGDLMTLRNSVPKGFTTMSFAQTLLHICLTLHILQTKNCLMHNDFWFRNVFFASTITNDRKCVDSISKVHMPLNTIDYYHYSILNVDGMRKDVYIKQTDILPIISDFGYSEFITDNGEYIYNGDFANRNPCKQIDGGMINYAWYPDIVLFLTTTLHTLLNKQNYTLFLNTPWKFNYTSVKECIDAIQQTMMNNDRTDRHTNIIVTILLALTSIFGNTTFAIALTQYNHTAIGGNFLNLYAQMNHYWSIYFYPDESAGTLAFDSWLVDDRHRSVRMNFKNYGNPQWTINTTNKTILPFTLSLFEYIKSGDEVSDVAPPQGAILNIVIDKAIPKFTDNIEQTNSQKITMLNGSFKPPPDLVIDGRNYGKPSYIKPIDTDSKESEVIFYSYEGIVLPGLSNITDGDNKKYIGYAWKQYINLIVLKTGSSLSAKMSFKREQLMETLKNIFKKNESDTNYVETDWGVAFSGGFFKHIDYAGPKNWKHCNNIKTDNPELVNTKKCFQPIGYTRNNKNGVNTNDQDTYNDVPDQYKDVYGSVCIKDNDLVKIVQPYISSDLTNVECNYVLASGPILTLNNSIKFTHNLITSPIYQGSMQSQSSINPHINNNGNKSILYLAGWLNHAFNLNPRAAIGVDKDNNVFLVTIEGREQRGSGCDLATLAKIMYSFGCVSSINLDGGGTADLLYKMPNSSCYVQANPVHLYKYPLMSLENSSSFQFTDSLSLGGGTKKTPFLRKTKLSKKLTRKNR